MKRYLLNGLISLALIAALGVSAETIDLEQYGAGRVRYVTGQGATLTFGKQQIDVHADYLVLLGSAFETAGARLELVTLNGNEYWVDADTTFHFEAMDNKGPDSVMFLGKGSFMVRTRYPFTLTTGAGFVYFPDKGVYLVSKDTFGKDKLYIYTKEGTRPATVKKSTIFSRIDYTDDVHNPELMAWTQQRIIDWKKTLVRCNMFSHVDKMPPYMATRGEDGKLKWQKVNTIEPIYRMSSIVDGNWFFYNPRLIHGMGLWSPFSTYMNDIEMALFFATNQYNSVRWAWDVANGWHAQWYYDPLAGFGAEYRFPMWRYAMLGSYWGPYPWDGMWRGPHMIAGMYYDRSGHENLYYLDAWLQRNFYQRHPTRIVRPESRDGQPTYDSRIPVRDGRSIQRVRTTDRPYLRQRTDLGLVNLGMAQRLSFDTRDVERAGRTIDLRRSRSRLSGGTTGGTTGRTSGRTVIRTTTSPVISSSASPGSTGSRSVGRSSKVVLPPR